MLTAARHEESLIGSAVAPLAQRRRDGDVVVADRFTNLTVDAARATGAEMLE